MNTSFFTNISFFIKLKAHHRGIGCVLYFQHPFGFTGFVIKPQVLLPGTVTTRRKRDISNTSYLIVGIIAILNDHLVAIGGIYALRQLSLVVKIVCDLILTAKAV